MITRPVNDTDTRDDKYIIHTVSGKLTDDKVVGWDQVVKLYKAVLTQLSNFGSSDPYVEIPNILRVVQYTPPVQRFTPQLKGLVKPLPKQPTGWFHHKNPAKVKTGTPIEYEDGWTPDPTGAVQSLPIPLVGCVYCGLELQSTVNSIRARVFKMTIEVEEEGPIDPTTDLPRIVVRKIPTYSTGRLCGVCKDVLVGVSGKPPRRGEFEYLHERIALRKRHTVTAGAMKSFDITLRKQQEEESKKFTDHGDVLTKEVPPIPEDVDIRAYRAFYKMGKGSGRSRGAHRYDPDVNKENSRVTK